MFDVPMSRRCHCRDAHRGLARVFRARGARREVASITGRGAAPSGVAVGERRVGVIHAASWTVVPITWSDRFDAGGHAPLGLAAGGLRGPGRVPGACDSYAWPYT